MPDGIPRNTRHFDSSVLPIPLQLGLRSSQPLGNVAMFLGRNVLKRRHAVVLHGPGGGFGMTSCVTLAKPAGIVVPSFSNELAEPCLPIVCANRPGHPVSPPVSRQHLVSALCVAVWGPPRENPGPRPNNRCLVPVSCVVPSAPWAWSARFGVHRGKTLGTVPTTGTRVLFRPSHAITWRHWLHASLRVPSAMPR